MTTEHMRLNSYTLFAMLVSLLLWAGLLALGRALITGLRMALYTGRW